MLKPDQLHTWINTVKSNLNSYVNSDRSLDSTEKTAAKSAYSSLCDDLRSACDNYFNSMSGAPLSDAIMSILSYLSFNTPEAAAPVANMKNYFSCDGIFTDSLLSINIKDTFYNSGVSNTYGMTKLNNFIDRVRGGSVKDIAGLNGAIGTMRSFVIHNAFAMVFETDNNKPNMNRLEMQDVARLIYNTYGVYDIITLFGFDIYIPSYIREEHS